MKKYSISLIVTLSVLLGIKAVRIDSTDDKLISYIVDLDNTELRMFHLDNNGIPLGNFTSLKSLVESNNQTLKFAMNGGMYLKDQSPQGLYIENGEIKNALNLKHSDFGNFYMKPNGIFAINQSNTPLIIKTEDYKDNLKLKYATQSGPMLVINGELHHRFNRGSKNTHIRNGVGILPDGRLIFAISKEKINFYDFAMFFKSKGCQNALYLDGFVSKLYLPEKEINQKGGRFGVIIGEVLNKKQ